jgi:hypothetical protein
MRNLDQVGWIDPARVQTLMDMRGDARGELTAQEVWHSVVEELRLALAKEAFDK